MKILKLYILCTLLFGGAAHAANGLIKFGVSPFGTNSLSDLKMLTVAREMRINDNLCWKVELGGYTDKRPGAKDSFRGNVSMGIVFRPWILDVRIYSGVGGITHTDKWLGSHLQFVQEFSAGVQMNGYAIMAFFDHTSSAGAGGFPNLGRDALGAQVVIPY